jgi:hypothetical protein
LRLEQISPDELERQRAERGYNMSLGNWHIRHAPRPVHLVNHRIPATNANLDLITAASLVREATLPVTVGPLPER